jgi:hypothetical protein
MFEMPGAALRRRVRRGCCIRYDRH